MSSGSLFQSPEDSHSPVQAISGANVNHAARVAVERGIENLSGPAGFTYSYDPANPPRVGQRVLVPLGRGSSHAPGIVIELGGNELAVGLRSVKPIASLTPAHLDDELLRLGRWISDYYICPLGMVYSSLLPAAVKDDTGTRKLILIDRARDARNEPLVLDQSQIDALPRAARTLWLALVTLDRSDFPLPARALFTRAGKSSPAGLKHLLDGGLLVQRNSTQITAAPLPGSQDTGSGDQTHITLEAPHALNPEQAAAAAGIIQTLGSFRVHLLRGVTGSGKTEVYLHVLAECLRRGHDALVLVPEISLTPQTASRFIARFGAANVAVLHSGLSAAQRHREWLRASRSGPAGAPAAKVIVGARSAVFAPLPNIGLIIVDEEHDGSYKQDRLPRYHGRDVAIKRASMRNATVILGSATPSMESWSSATSGKFALWHLTRRASGAPLPNVSIVDLREESKLRASRDVHQHLIGPTLEKRMRQTLAGGHQVILLLNRRGVASYISCRNPGCGFIVSCDQCDTNLVLHKHAGVPRGGFVRCHHCDSQQLVPLACPACTGKLHLFAGGTQRLEDEISAKFANVGLIEGTTFARVDSDSIGGFKDLHETLTRFGRGELRLLLGTQMIAKGLDFPGIALVGVIDADTSLHIPDFRSWERTFQLLSQVAGRAGRAGPASVNAQVIIQTNSPLHPAITLAQRHDYITFATQELATRTAAGLPPATRMARIVCRDTVLSKAQHAAETMFAALTHAAPPTISLRGPLPCSISRIANYFRMSIDVVAPDARTLHLALDVLRKQSLLTSDAATAVDIDPTVLM
jgi:primosomal protein N' (replication factor Y)